MTKAAEKKKWQSMDNCLAGGGEKHTLEEKTQVGNRKTAEKQTRCGM
jgi:hypothetical protein